MTRIPATSWVPCPRSWHGPRDTTKINKVVIHTIEGSAMGALSWFNSSSNPYGTGALLVISQTKAYQTADFDTYLWHCINANLTGVGIEHQGYASYSKVKWLSSANRKMLRMSANRTAWICWRFGLGVPERKKNVFGHVDVPGNDHVDPGKGWPWWFYMWLCKRAYRNLKATNGERWT